MSKREDTGYLTSVPAEDRLDFDGEDLADYALEGGDDTEFLNELEEGEVVEQEELL
jgi:hypothetical protein